MFLVFIVARSVDQRVTKCLKIRKAYNYYCLENTHFVTNTVLKEGYIIGRYLLRHASFGLLTILILMKHSIMIRYSITLVIYCHIDMHCRSLLCVPEYFSVNVQIMPIHPYFPLSISCTICYVPVCVRVCVKLMNNQLNLPMFSSLYVFIILSHHQTIQCVCTFAYSHEHEARNTHK